MARHVGARRLRRFLALAAALFCSLSALAACGGNGGKTGVALIIKTETNPYFVSMKQAAIIEAKKAGTHLSVAAGSADGDTQTQINAIDTAIARGDKGILITSNGPAVNAALRQAKAYGLFVIALDTPLDPASTADVTYATNNFEAGKLIGSYAARKLNGQKAVIAMLDLYDDQVVSVDIDRDHGFLTGMGINPGSKTLNAKEPKSGNYSAARAGSTRSPVTRRPREPSTAGARRWSSACRATPRSTSSTRSTSRPARAPTPRSRPPTTTPRPSSSRSTAAAGA